MTYATKQDLLERFGDDEMVQLTDELAQGELDDVKITRALTDADADINGYLANRYALPLATTPPMIRRLACEIARYHLYNKAPTDAVKQRYQDAIRTLEAIAKGVVGLGLDGLGTPVTSAGAPDFTAPDRIFTHDSLKDFG